MPAWFPEDPRQEPVLLRSTDHVPGAPVGAATANKLLKELRNGPAWSVDLTDGPFNWKGFLATRGDFADVVGNGVIRFAFDRFEDVPDHNYSGAPRGDFVVLRVDLSAVRLHPAKTNPQPHPIYGRPGAGVWGWHWGARPPRAAPRIAGVASPHTATEQTVMKADDAKDIAPVDYVSRERAREFLARTIQRMETEGTWREDITLGQQFQWWRWIANLGPGPKQVKGHVITHCWVVGVDQVKATVEGGEVGGGLIGGRPATVGRQKQCPFSAWHAHDHDTCFDQQLPHPQLCLCLLCLPCPAGRICGAVGG